MTHRLRAPRGAALLLLAACMAAPLEAQDRPFPYSLTQQDLALASAGVATSLLGWRAVDGVAPISLTEIRSLDARGVNSFDRNTIRNWSTTWQDLSDWPRDALIVGSALLTGAAPLIEGEWGEVATLGTIFIETAAITTGVTYTVKGLASRTRPYAYNTDLTPEERLEIAGSGGGVHLSFFSGHTSAAFAAATLMSTVYSDIHGLTTTAKVIWISSLSLASVTGYARIQGGMHFPTDVIVGALVGSAIGHLVPRLHRKGTEGPLSLSAGPGGFGLSLAVGGR